jgi:hypothetical protein
MGSRPIGLRARYALVLVTGYLIWTISYQLVGRFAAQLPTHDLTSALDRAIPLWPLAVWPYEACYLLPFVPVLIARDWHRVNIWLLACLLANLSAFLVYLALPVAFPRPSLGNSLAERIIALEYELDFHPGANNLPSMHVALSWLTLFACHRQGLPRYAFAALTSLVLAITPATLLVKQHIVLDAVTGLIWALASWQIVSHYYWKRRTLQPTSAGD